MLRVALGRGSKLAGRNIAPVASARVFGTAPAVDQARMVADLVDVSQNAAKEVVPWFIKNMPVCSFVLYDYLYPPY